MLTSFADLKSFLTSRGVAYAADDARQVLEIPTTIRGEAHAGVVLWDPRALLLHVIQVLRVDVPEGRELALADAVSRINHALVLPGFGFDHAARQVYYRWVVPRAVDGGMSEDDVDRAVRTVLESCRDFLPALRAVASGEAPSDQVMMFSNRLRDEERAKAH